MKRVTCSTYEAYFTMGSVEGYHGLTVPYDILLAEIGKFQTQYEKEYGYSCGVRAISSEVVFQSYREPCWDIRVIQYPRFQMSVSKIELFIESLAEHLMLKFKQERITVITPDHTTMLEIEGADESRIHDPED